MRVAGRGHHEAGHGGSEPCRPVKPQDEVVTIHHTVMMRILQ
jgi:hypothetical protein